MLTFSHENLRSLRKTMGFTQRALAEKIGTSERQYQFWENGKHEPTATYLLRMMLALQCPAQALLKEES